MLKQLVRNHIDPTKDLGHSDTHGKKKKEDKEENKVAQIEKGVKDIDLGGETTRQRDPDEGVKVKRNPDGTICEDCR